MSEAIYSPHNIRVEVINKAIDIDIKEFWINGEVIHFGSGKITKQWNDVKHKCFDHVTRAWVEVPVRGINTYVVTINELPDLPVFKEFIETEGDPVAYKPKQLAFLAKTHGYPKDFIGNMILTDFRTDYINDVVGGRVIHKEVKFVANLTEVAKLM